MKRNGFTLIELLVVVAIIGILAAVGVVAYNGYTSSAKANASKANMDVIYKTWLNEKALCTVKGGRESALWNKTTCQVLLSSTTSDVSRVSGILMTYFGVNYYLDGLHSYAAGDAFPIPSFVFPTFVTLIFISFIGFFRFKKWVN